MYALKDIKSHELKQFDTLEKAEEYTENHNRPNDLVNVDIWYADGSGWNGKRSGYAYGKEGNINVVWIDTNKTNNMAEYIGVIECLNEAGYFDIIRTDSLLVVKQVNKFWKVKNKVLRILHKEAVRIMNRKAITVVWTSRNKNLAGIAIDQAKKRK